MPNVMQQIEGLKPLDAGLPLCNYIRMHKTRRSQKGIEVAPEHVGGVHPGKQTRFLEPCALSTTRVRGPSIGHKLWESTSALGRVIRGSLCKMVRPQTLQPHSLCHPVCIQMSCAPIWKERFRDHSIPCACNAVPHPDMLAQHNTRTSCASADAGSRLPFRADG